MKNSLIIIILLVVVVLGYLVLSKNSMNLPSWQPEVEDVKVEETPGFQQSFKITDPSQVYPEMP
jgi:hypothetical protein